MKILIIVCFIAFALVSQHSNAQTKIGYFNSDQMLSLMPEKQKIDSVLGRYQNDSINSTLNRIVKEYQDKDSLLTKTDTSKTAKPVLNQLRTDVSVLAYQIQNWQALSNQAMNNKAGQMYAPLYNRIDIALKQVAKEKGYVYILSKQIFVVAPDGDDLLPLVATKLGVKIPNSLTRPTGKANH